MGTARDNLPFVDIVNIEGLNTKTNPDMLSPTNLQVAKNLDFYEEYGSVNKFKGATRVTSPQITEGGAAVPVSWLGFYKSQDFAGQILREVLFQAGTKMYILNGSSYTELDSGQPSRMFRDSDMFNRFMLITGQNPYLTAGYADKYKFDGFQLGRWGVTPPGREETVVEPFTSVTGFTAASCAISNESSVAYRGGSQKIVKDSGGNEATVTKLSMTPFEVNTIVEDRLEFHVYIPELSMKRLKQGVCLRLWFGSDNGFGAGDSYVWYDFRIGEFQKGWNTLSCDFSIYPSGDLGGSNLPVGFDDTQIDCIKYTWFFGADYQAEEITVYMDHMVSLPQGSPLLTGGAAGTTFPGGTGAVWSYVVTFENQYGHESNHGTALPSDAEPSLEDIVSTTIYGYNDVADGDLAFTDTQNETTGVGLGADGDNCIQFGHAGGGGTGATIEIQDQAFDMSTDVVGSYVYLDVYIEAGAAPGTGIRDKLATDGLRVRFADKIMNNYWEWRFNSNTLEEGDWTTLTIDTSNPDIINGEIDLTNITNVVVIFEFKDTVVATIADTDLKVNNLRTSTTNSYASWELSEIPVSSDPDVIKRHIYRTVANGTTYFYVGTIYDNSTTIFSDTVSDSALGIRQPPQSGQFADNTVPPDAGIVKVWKQTVFMAGDPKDPNVLYFSRDELPEAFPIINGFELDSPITGMFETSNALIVTTDKDWWRVIGDNPDYFVDRVMRNMGNVGYRTCGENRLYGWAHDTDAIRMYDLNDTNRFSEPIADKINDLNKVNLKDAWSVYSKTLNAMLFFYPNASGDYTTCYVYQFSMDNVNDGRWFQLDLPSYANYLCGVEVEGNLGTDHLYVGSEDGAIFELGTGTFELWMNGDASELDAVTSTLQSIFIRAGQMAIQTRGWTGRWKPSFIEVRARDNFSTSTTWTITVESADGSWNDQTVRDTQSVTVTFPAGVSIQRVRLKDFVAGEYCRVTAVNEDSLAHQPVLQGIRVYVEARPGQFVVSGSTPGGRS